MCVGRKPWDIPKTPEERLTGLLERIGPVVGLGKPGESLPPLGASRLYVDDESWPETVRTYISSARAVLFGPGDTEFFWKEVALARDLARPDRMLFWFPQSTYADFRGELSSRLNLSTELPESRL